eukprot:30378-Pyramimonas_sp.AAC.1
MLAGLAQVIAADARNIANEAIEQFNKDPRQVVHDPITWKLMREDSPFRIDLNKFAEGAPFNTLSTLFQLQVACFRFYASVETTIEEKHARVTLAK